MTTPASGYIPDVVFIGLWGFLAGFSLCLWLVQRSERSRDRKKAEPKP